MKLIKELHQQSISRISVIMRHSARNRITSVEDVLSIGITEQGKKAAYRFGERFPSDLSIQLFSSPVGRRQETAACIANGHREQGGEAETPQIINNLGPFYIKDSQTVDRLRTLYISHDWNIFLLKELCLGLPHEEFGDVHFLEGLVLYESQGEYYLAHHHGEPKRIHWK